MAELFPLERKTEKSGNHCFPLLVKILSFNPIALRKAKILNSFGLSWC